LLLFGGVVVVTVAVGVNELASLGFRFFSVGDTAVDDRGGASLVPSLPSLPSLPIPSHAVSAPIAARATTLILTPILVPICFKANACCAMPVSRLC